MKKLLLALFAAVLPQLLTAANFPGAMSGSDIEKTNQQLAGAIQHRSWTHSGVRPRDVDFTFGLESSLTFNTNVNKYGDGRGRVPSAMPVPRVYGSAAFRPDIHVSASAFPGESLGGVSTYGLAGELFFHRDPKNLSYSVLLHYSYSRLFGDYRAHTQGLQFAANHEFEAFILYASAGIISIESRVRPGLLSPGTEDKPYGSFHPHFILGSKIDADFPVSIQTELIRSNFNLALLIAKDF